MLYGVCHAAIVSLGFSTGLGFIHTGKMLSFVYDIADLYKKETSIPAAFEATRSYQSDSGVNLERHVRTLTRQKIADCGILKRIADDLAWIFNIPVEEEQINKEEVGKLWDDQTGSIDGGVNYS